MSLQPFPILTAALAAFPAAALWASWPRRSWAGRAATGLCLGLWLFGFSLIEDSERSAWAWAGLFSVAASLYATYVVSRNVGDIEALEAKLVKGETRLRALSEKVAQAKARIGRVENEQREMLALYGMIKGLSESLGWDQVRPKIETAVRQILTTERFAVFVADSKGAGPLRTLASARCDSSIAQSWVAFERFLQEKGLSARVPHVLEKPEPAIALPIFEESELSGYLYARLPEGAEGGVLMEKAQSLAEELVFAFRRVRLFQEVERHSRVDGLTGVLRRSVLDAKLKEEIVRAGTFKTSFCLMILDIDHFKSLNDRYGHPFGDQVLRRIGGVLKESVYETDIVARYGGEEFALLLPRAEPEGVLRKAEALRAAIERTTFEIAMEKVSVTASIGIAHFPRDGESAEAVIRQADQALYYAKEHGRNQVVDISRVRDR